MLLELPNEILILICSFLHDNHAQSLQSVASVCKRLHQIAIRFVFQTLYISFDEKSIYEKITWWQDFIDRQKAHDFIQRLHLWSWIVCAELGLESAEAVGNLVRSLPRLSDILLSTEQDFFSENFLDKIHKHMPACRVHIDTLCHKKVHGRDGLESSYFAFLESPNLHSLGLQCCPHDEFACCLETVGQYLAAGLLPNLDTLSLYCRPRDFAVVSGGRNPYIPSKGGFQASDPPIAKQKTRLRRLNVINDGILLTSSIQLWREHIDFDSLRMLQMQLDLEHFVSVQYQVISQGLCTLYLPSLTSLSLYIQISTRTRYVDPDTFGLINELLTNLNPLESLELMSCVNTISIYNTVLRHHGKSLRSLLLWPGPQANAGYFTWDDFPAMVENFPLLESLGLVITSHEKPLCDDLFSWLQDSGRTSKLRNLQLVMLGHLGNFGPVGDSPTTQGGEPNQGESIGSNKTSGNQHSTICRFLNGAKCKEEGVVHPPDEEICQHIFRFFAGQTSTGNEVLERLYLNIEIADRWKTKALTNSRVLRIIERDPREDCSDQVIITQLTGSEGRLHKPHFLFTDFKTEEGLTPREITFPSKYQEKLKYAT